MDINQPSSTPVYAPVPAAPDVFGTRIPSAVTFAIAVLLFFLPFVDIKCNGMKLQDVSGIELATGFKMKNGSSDMPYLNDVKPDGVDKAITKSATKTDNKNPNLYAMIALGIGVLGLGLCFVKNKMAAGGGVAAGVLAAGALIGLMIDIKREVKTGLFGDLANKTKDATNGELPSLEKGLNNIGNQFSDLKIAVDFTPWFYVAVIAFLTAAFFCYKRMSSMK